MIYSADPEDEWDSEAAMLKANPNIDVSVNKTFLQSKRGQAKASARYQGPFKTKHLNLWVGAVNAYFNIEDWKRCSGEVYAENYAQNQAWIALDLASKKDIAALRVLIDCGDGEYATYGRQYLPEEGEFGANTERYNEWTEDGWLIRTPGNVIDFAQIEADVLEIAKQFSGVTVAYDPYQGNYLATRLAEQGIDVVEYGATVKNFSDPMKSLDAWIAAAKIRHDGDPCMTGMLSNVVAKEDAKENVFPRKARNENKIDGAVALIMCVGMANVGQEQEEQSFWMTSGGSADEHISAAG